MSATEQAISEPDKASAEVEVTTESVVEAILFATDAPVSAAKIAQILAVGTAGDVKDHIQSLNDKYVESGMAFRIDHIAKGYQMLTLPAYKPWLTKLLRVRGETRLSPAALETLAVVSYRQPVLRAEIESIRGVAAGDMLNRLRELNLVKIVGRAEEIGRPMLYGTTKHFLEVFGLGTLDDLPEIEDVIPPPQPDAETNGADDAVPMSMVDGDQSGGDNGNRKPTVEADSDSSSDAETA